MLKQLVPFIALLSLLPLVPESPRWLLMRDRLEEGAESLRRYLGKGLSVDDLIVRKELASILGAIRIERESKISIKEVITLKDRSGHLKRLLLGCGGQFMQVGHQIIAWSQSVSTEIFSKATRRYQCIALLFPNNFDRQYRTD